MGLGFRVLRGILRFLALCFWGTRGRPPQNPKRPMKMQAVLHRERVVEDATAAGLCMGSIVNEGMVVSNVNKVLVCWGFSML